MDGECRMERPPLELRREFAGGRLEAQVLARTYELVVPVIRRPFATGLAPGANDRAGGWNRAGRIAQGA
jgi:hypothetical protein